MAHPEIANQENRPGQNPPEEQKNEEEIKEEDDDEQSWEDSELFDENKAHPG
jgi:hypothetical protein